MSFEKMFSKSIENIIIGEPYSDCSHEKTIDDYNTGDTICTDCGTVTFDKIFDFVPNNTHSNEESDFNFNEIFQFIKNVCDNMHLPNNIADETFSYYKKILIKMPKRKFPLKHLAAFSFYMTLNLMNCSRIPDEIEFYTGVSKKVFFKIESFFPSSQIYNNTTDLVNLYCSSLDLKFKDVFKISITVEEMSQFENIQPQSLIAYCIYEYSKCNGLDLPMDNIVVACQTSKSTLLRLIRKYKK